MPGYMTSTVVSAALDKFAGDYPDTCTRFSWLAGPAGASAGYVLVKKAVASSPPNRWPVLISGGVHARELAPPDALVSFLKLLLDAYSKKKSIVYPAWASTVDPVIYDSFTIDWPSIRSVVEKVDLYVAPLVNADGRDFVLAPLPAGTSLTTQMLHKDWRKNRRPAPVGSASPYCVGVDLNRNFDIVWDFKKFYNTAIAGVQTSDQPCNSDLYCGPAQESEPETKNLAGLMRSKQISFFLDVHQYSRDVMFSWGIETNQSTVADQNFANPAWDGKRDGTLHDTYKEYIPASAAFAGEAMAKRMSQWILTKAGGSQAKAQARSAYKVIPSADLYVTSGACDDYCFSRWFTAATAGAPISPVMALTIEVGGDPSLGPDNDDGGFSPDYVNQYPKLEREVHAAAWAFLTAIAATGFQGPSAPPGPAKDPGTCFIAGAAYGDPGHPAVLFLRDVRDRQLGATQAGKVIATVLTAGYIRLSPPVAAWLRGRPRMRAAVRAWLLDPLVALLTHVSDRTRGTPRLRSLALTLILLLVAVAALTAVAALAEFLSRAAQLFLALMREAATVQGPT
jgi:zinc carboxypeptidase